MGCDLHSHVEVRKDGRWQDVTGSVDWGWDSGPFEDRSYNVYGWLAGVRNYSAVGPVEEPRGFPDDASVTVRQDFEGWGWDGHTPSWFLVSELLAVDYDATVNNRRVNRQLAPNYWSGDVTGKPEEGEIKPLREFLGTPFMDQLDTLATLGDPENVRVVFWFDN